VEKILKLNCEEEKAAADGLLIQNLAPSLSFHQSLVFQGPKVGWQIVQLLCWVG
jgi:hypothetical protein